MSGSSPIRVLLHSKRSMIVLLLLLPALACRVFAPAMPTSDANEGIRIRYPIDIETILLDNGTTVVADYKGSYCLAFPSQWKVGAFHEDFAPTMATYCEINGKICSLFQQLYGKDNSLRIFAIDTTPGHLTEDNMTVIHIGLFQEAWRLQSTMEELALEYIAYINSSGQLKITDTYYGKTGYEIPFTILLIERRSVSTETAMPSYSGVVLLKTDKAYVEMLYTTFDQSIHIVDELNPILSNFAACDDRGGN